MAIIKPFKGLRPPKNIAQDVACLPYDVMNTEEALKMAEGFPRSQQMASIMLTIIGRIGYLAYGAIFTRAVFPFAAKGGKT